MAGFFAVIGHILPIYYGFKGGKGVLCTSAMALILTPIEFVILLAVFVLIVWWSKYVSLGSVIAGVLFPVVMRAYFAIVFNSPMPGLAALSTILIACLIVWCHRGNLQRISNRTERKISFGKKNGNE
jgi:glycerol-3-phosphate acyltransferase PlsY